MKRKFKLFLLSVLFVFSASFISACGKNNIEIDFNVDGTYFMSLNQEIELEELVDISGGKINNVSFYSSNEEVVYVTPSNKLIARSEGEAIIGVKNYEATLTISVKGLEIKFNAPTHLTYDDTLNRICWYAVYAGNTVANSYSLQISKNGADYVEYQSNKNYYTIEGTGEYKVKVACNERNGIQSSEYSEEYIFTKLSAPTNLQYNDSTKTLTWDADNSITSFYVKVNGILSEKISDKQYALNLENEQEYEISVISCATNEENVFGSTCLNSLHLTRLKAVEIKIDSGLVTWNDTQPNVNKYKIEVFNSSNLANAIQTDYISKNNIGKYSYALSSVSDVNLSYSVKITALGDVDENINKFD